MELVGLLYYTTNFDLSLSITQIDNIKCDCHRSDLKTNDHARGVRLLLVDDRKKWSPTKDRDERKMIKATYYRTQSKKVV